MENDLTLAVTTKGAEDAKAKLASVAGGLTDTGKSTDDLSDKLTKAGIAIGAIGAGLTIYAKKATDGYVDYVKQVNGLARITGDTVENTSALQTVLGQTGVDSGTAAGLMTKFSKQIVATNDATGEQADKMADLRNKIQAAQIKIQALNDDTKKNGDVTGTNANQVEALNLQVKGYTKSLGEAATPLEKLGVATKDAAGNARPMSEVFLDVADKFKGMQNGAEKTQLATELFGKSGTKLLPILNKGSDGIKEMEDNAKKMGLVLSQDNVDAVAKYTAAHRKMDEAVKGFNLQVGQDSLPLYQKLADAGVWLTDKFQGLPGPVREAAASVVAFGGPILTATGAAVGFASNLTSIDFGKVQKGIGLVTGPIGKMAGGFADAAGWIGKNTVEMVKNGAMAVATAAKWLVMNGAQLAVRAGTALWTAAQWALNVALNANPIGLIIIALVALAALFVLLWTHSQTFRDIVTGAFQIVWGAIQAVWNWISSNWPLLLAILTGPIGWAVYAIIQNWETIKGAFAAAWQFIQLVWSAVAGWFGGVWNGIVAVFAGVGGWFASIFQSAVNGIRNAWGGISGFFQGIWNGIVNIFGSIGAAVGNGIVGAVKGVVNGILSGAEGIVNGFVNAINGVIGTINRIPGVNIGKIGALHLPRLAEGGIVKATPGGVHAIIGEGGQDEAVIPLDKLAAMIKGGGGGKGNTYNITANLNTAEAVKAFYAELDNDTILSNRGLTPIRGGI